MRLPSPRRVLKKLERELPVVVYRKRPHHHYVADYYGRSAYKQPDITSDPQFGELAKRAMATRRTMLYYDRLHTIFHRLRDAARASGGAPIGAVEIGVFRGGTSFFIASVLDAIGLAGSTLDCFDTFEGHPGQDLRAGVDDLEVHTPNLFDTTDYGEVVELLKPFPGVRVHKGRVQDTFHLLDLRGGRRLHFVHLDVDIYDPTMWVLEQLDEVLAVGGSVVVDDYGFLTCGGAKQAVDEFLARNAKYASIPLLTGQHVLVKVS